MEQGKQKECEPASRPLYRVLTVTGIYPTKRQPHAGTFIKSQVDSLLEAGLEVEIIHPQPGLALLRYMSATWQVFRKTLSGTFDVVHAHYGLWCLAALLGSALARTPVVGSFLGDDLLGTPTGDGAFSKKSLLIVHCSRWLCRRVNAVIVKSREMAEAAGRGQRRFRSVEKKIAVVANGVDFNLFQPVPRGLARAALGWKQDRFYILFGNDPQIPRKNYALAEAAVAQLSASGRDVELIVANGLAQEQVARSINASNALILPSLSEGSPNIVKEAMACNVPVVATDVGDVAEVIGKTAGCAVCPPDAEALALALEKALRYERTTGREDIQHLDRRVVARRVIEVYDYATRKQKGRMQAKRRTQWDDESEKVDTNEMVQEKTRT